MLFATAVATPSFVEALCTLSFLPDSIISILFTQLTGAKLSIHILKMCHENVCLSARLFSVQNRLAHHRLCIEGTRSYCCYYYFILVSSSCCLLLVHQDVDNCLIKKSITQMTPTHLPCAVSTECSFPYFLMTRFLTHT